MTVARSRPRDAEASRQRLMDIGAALFAERGFKGATLDLVAARSGLNKAMVAYYFGSKAGLYQAVLDAGVEAVLARLDAAELDGLESEERLPALTQAIAAGLADAPYLPGMLVQDYLGGSQQKRPAAMASLSRLFETTRGIVEQGQAEGRIRDADPHLVHLSIVGGLVFYGLTAPYRATLQAEGRWPASNPNITEFADFLGTMIALGLKPPGKS